MSKKLESRFLKLVRPNDDCEQAIKGYKDLTLIQGIGRLNELLVEAGKAAQNLYLPQLAGHELAKFSDLLTAARMLSRFPQAEEAQSSLKGIMDGWGDCPEPAFICKTTDDETIKISLDSISKLLVFEKEIQVFRDLQWLYRCWGAVIQGIWASKLFREIHCQLNSQLALPSTSIVTDGSAEPVADWTSWEGSGWETLELAEYSDKDIERTWKQIDEIVRSNEIPYIDPAGPLHEWIKGQTVRDIEEMGLTNDEVSELLFITTPGRHRPNLDISVEFSVEMQQFMLAFPLKTHDVHGHNRKRLHLSQAVLDRFLQGAGEQTKMSLIRTLLHTKRYAIIQLTSNMIVPDLS